MDNSKLKNLVVVLFASFIWLSGCSQSNTTKIILTAPSSTSDSDTVHIAGNFNDWAVEGFSAKQMRREEDKFVIELSVSDEPVLYTFVKNQSWQHGPAQAYGKGMCQFAFDPLAQTNDVKVSFPAWGGDVKTEVLSSSLVGDIEYLPNIEIPQLSRQRDVWVYLPPGYHHDNSNTYPVLYMLDGQNVFDRKTSYSGEWQVDEALQRMIGQMELKELIIVAVGNGPERMSEYSPLTFKYGESTFEGEGDKTLEFITQTLKPMIDNKYRTDKSRQNTGIAGSSLGGLMAIHAGAHYGDIFGFVGAFSPSLSIQTENGANVIFQSINTAKNLDNVKIYADMGYGEYGSYERFDQFSTLLKSKMSDENLLLLVKDRLGRHCEASWAERFPAAIKWLTSSVTTY